MTPSPPAVKYLKVSQSEWESGNYFTILAPPSLLHRLRNETFDIKP